MAKPGIFITGTSTEVGKTLVSAMILYSAVLQGLDIRYFKPVQTGEDSDCNRIKELTGLQDPYVVEPLFAYQWAAAPYRAALQQNKAIDVRAISRYIQSFNTISPMVEGAGGLLVPLTRNLSVRDLVKRLDLPLLIVASTQLGTINHILLTIQAAESAKIPVKGLILSGVTDFGLAATLKNLTAVPILAEIPQLTITANMVKEVAVTIFQKKLLEKIFV